MTRQRQEEEKKQTASKQPESSRSSSTTTYHTDPGVSLQDLEVIRQQYEKLLGPLNAVKAYDIERAFQNGLKTSAILDALEQTAMAPRPTHYYFRAIIVRYMQEGITTEEAAEKQRFQRRNQRMMQRITRDHEWYDSPEDAFEWKYGR